MGLFSGFTDIYVIPDTQSKKGVKNPLIPIAKHICDLRPKNVIHLGDHWDFPSLSTYDKGKKSHRALTYLDDVTSGNEAMDEFWAIIQSQWPKFRSQCKWTILKGNHEERRTRALEYGPDELVSLIEEFPLNYKNWHKVIPFLTEINIAGVNFCHYFQSANSANALSTPISILNQRHSSCVAGHKQGFEYRESLAGNKKRIQVIIAGSCYYHDEDYKTHNNHHFRGTVHLKNVKGGMFDFSTHELLHLDKRYKK